MSDNEIEDGMSDTRMAHAAVMIGDVFAVWKLGVLSSKALDPLTT